MIEQSSRTPPIWNTLLQQLDAPRVFNRLRTPDRNRRAAEDAVPRRSSAVGGAPLMAKELGVAGPIHRCARQPRGRKSGGTEEKRPARKSLWRKARKTTSAGSPSSIRGDGDGPAGGTGVCGGRRSRRRRAGGRKASEPCSSARRRGRAAARVCAAPRGGGVGGSAGAAHGREEPPKRAVLPMRRSGVTLPGRAGARRGRPSRVELLAASRLGRRHASPRPVPASSWSPPRAAAPCRARGDEASGAASRRPSTTRRSQGAGSSRFGASPQRAGDAAERVEELALRDGDRRAGPRSRALASLSPCRR